MLPLARPSGSRYAELGLQLTSRSFFADCFIRLGLTGCCDCHFSDAPVEGDVPCGRALGQPRRRRDTGVGYMGPTFWWLCRLGLRELDSDALCGQADDQGNGLLVHILTSEVRASGPSGLLGMTLISRGTRAKATSFAPGRRGRTTPRAPGLRSSCSQSHSLSGFPITRTSGNKASGTGGPTVPSATGASSSAITPTRSR